MKKIISLLLCIVLLVMCFVACNNTEDTPETESNTVSTIVDDTETKAPDTDDEKDKGNNPGNAGDTQIPGNNEDLAGTGEQLPNIKYILWSEDFEGYDNLINPDTKTTKGYTTEADLLAAMGMRLELNVNGGGSPLSDGYIRDARKNDQSNNFSDAVYYLDEDLVGNTYMLSYNRSWSQDGVVLFSDDVMDVARLGSYVIEYDMIWLPYGEKLGTTQQFDAISAPNHVKAPRYVGVYYGANEDTAKNAMAHSWNDFARLEARIAATGGGDSVGTLGGTSISLEAAASDGIVESLRHGGQLEGFASLHDRLFPDATEFKDKVGFDRQYASEAEIALYSNSFAGKKIHVKIEFSVKDGVNIYANGILVSKFNTSQMSWDLLNKKLGSTIGIHSTERTAAYFDNFEVYCMGRVGSADKNLSETDISTYFTKVDDNTYTYNRGSYNSAQ